MPLDNIPPTEHIDNAVKALEQAHRELYAVGSNEIPYRITLQLATLAVRISALRLDLVVLAYDGLCHTVPIPND